MSINFIRQYTRHRDFVRLAIMLVVQDLELRSVVHDASKMMEDEFEGYSRINHQTVGTTFGSPEYQAAMESGRKTVDLHFSRNAHHPEHRSLTSESLTFLDIIEMVCDWWGACHGYDDSKSWETSLAESLERKAKYLSPEQIWLATEVGKFLQHREQTDDKT